MTSDNTKNDPWNLRGLETWECLNVYRLSDALQGANKDLTEAEVKTLKWLASEERQTVTNICSILRKTARHAAREAKEAEKTRAKLAAQQRKIREKQKAMKAKEDALRKSEELLLSGRS